MQISGNSDAYQATQAQRALSMLLQQAGGDAGQTQPSGATAGPTTAAGRPAAGPGDQFAPATLSGLLSVQQQAPPSSADLAAELMSQADTNGDGQLSADEIRQALGQDSSSGGDLTASISKLDTNGDGQLSTDELTAGLDTARKAHHHHHHGAEAASSGQPQTSAAAGPTPASADETSATS